MAVVTIDCRRLLHEFHPAEGTIPEQLLRRLSEAKLPPLRAYTPTPAPEKENDSDKEDFVPFDHEKFGAPPELRVKPKLTVQISREAHPTLFTRLLDTPTPPSSPSPVKGSLFEWEAPASLFDEIEELERASSRQEEDELPPLAPVQTMPEEAWFDGVPPLASIPSDAVFELFSPSEEEELVPIIMVDHGPIDDIEEGITFDGIHSLFGDMVLSGDDIPFTEETFQEEEGPEDVFAAEPEPVDEFVHFQVKLVHFRVTCPACSLDEVLVTWKRNILRKSVFEAEYEHTQTWVTFDAAFVRNGVEYVSVKWRDGFVPSENISNIDNLEYHQIQIRPSHQVFHGFQNTHRCGPRRNMIISFPVDHQPPCYCF